MNISPLSIRLQDHANPKYAFGMSPNSFMTSVPPPQKASSSDSSPVHSSGLQVSGAPNKMTSNSAKLPGGLPAGPMVASDRYLLHKPQPAGLHAQVLQEMGLAIAAGSFPVGVAITIEEVEQRFGVSRSVVRECLRSLSALGMVQTKRRVGISVQPMENWNVFDLNVIRWRLESDRRNQQLRSITELRNAIEPEAVRLACKRATHTDAADLVSLAGQLWSAGKEGDNDEFLRLDIVYHQLILDLSGNEMFANLKDLIAEILVGRTHHGLMPQFPHEHALQLHVDIAQAVQRREADAAAHAMREILKRTFAEMSSIWQASGSSTPFEQD